MPTTPTTPALRLGVLMGVANRHRVDKLVIADQTRHGVGDWIEQLVAESTGKLGKGVLPVVVPFENAVNFNPSTADSILVSIGSTDAPEAQSGWAAAIDADLGAQMLLWEVAVVVAGRIIGINPFDQPDVESAKQAARELLSGGGEVPTPDATDDGIDVYGEGCHRRRGRHRPARQARPAARLSRGAGLPRPHRVRRLRRCP